MVAETQHEGSVLEKVVLLLRGKKQEKIVDYLEHGGSSCSVLAQSCSVPEKSALISEGSIGGIM